MSTKYKATMPDKAYFITTTTVGWVDVFTRVNQKQAIIDALKYCQQNKGLEIFAYCLMPSHLHVICSAKDELLLSNIMRDFKKFTSQKIISLILNEPESRREWLLSIFKNACAHLKREQVYKVWQDGYHAEMIDTNRFMYQKLQYIHNNPVKDNIVFSPEDYRYSSARNYADLDFDLNVILLPKQLMTVY